MDHLQQLQIVQFVKDGGGSFRDHMWISGANSGYNTAYNWTCMICGTVVRSPCDIRPVGSDLPEACRYCGGVICEVIGTVPNCPSCGSAAMRSDYKYKAGYGVVTGSGRCYNRGQACSTCGGSGKVTVGINCIHGKSGTHQYCVHGLTYQHE